MSRPMSRPQFSEFNPYYRSYVDQVGDGSIVDILRNQGQETAGFLQTIPENRRTHRYAPGKWSVNEVIGHVVDAERMFAYRALAFARGETQSLPGFDHDVYVLGGQFDARTVADMVQAFEATRASTLALLGSLPGEAWIRAGVANNSSMSVRALAYVMAGHETHHMGVLRDRYLS